MSPVTIPFGATLMRDYIEVVVLTNDKKGDFITKSSLETNVQCIEIVSLDAQINKLCSLNLIVDNTIQDLR